MKRWLFRQGHGTDFCGSEVGVVGSCEPSEGRKKRRLVLLVESLSEHPQRSRDSLTAELLTAGSRLFQKLPQGKMGRRKRRGKFGGRRELQAWVPAHLLDEPLVCRVELVGAWISAIVLLGEVAFVKGCPIKP